jgi:hypothetical protein
MGIRVLEPAFIQGANSSIFFAVAWVIGAELGARIGVKADPRSVLGMPFVYSASLAAFGQVTGPGSIFLYAASGGAAAMIMHSGTRTKAGASSPALAFARPAALAAGLIWATAIGRYDLPVTVWVTSGVLLVTGFSGLAKARSARAPALRAIAGDADSMMRMPVESAEPRTAEPVSVEPSEREILEAVELLLEATRRARTIRTKALERFRDSRRGPGEVFEEILDELHSTADRCSLIKLGGSSPH